MLLPDEKIPWPGVHNDNNRAEQKMTCFRPFCVKDSRHSETVYFSRKVKYPYRSTRSEIFLRSLLHEDLCTTVNTTVLYLTQNVFAW